MKTDCLLIHLSYFLFEVALRFSTPGNVVRVFCFCTARRGNQSHRENICGLMMHRCSWPDLRMLILCVLRWVLPVLTLLLFLNVTFLCVLLFLSIGWQDSMKFVSFLCRSSISCTSRDLTNKAFWILICTVVNLVLQGYSTRVSTQIAPRHLRDLVRSDILDLRIPLDVVPDQSHLPGLVWILLMPRSLGQSLIWFPPSGCSLISQNPIWCFCYLAWVEYSINFFISSPTSFFGICISKTRNWSCCSITYS